LADASGHQPVPPPAAPKIYHIIHVDRLASVIADGGLLCDEIIAGREAVGTTIGMSDIKARRLVSQLISHQGLRVGQCVPFYFCPRSVMLYLIYRANHPNLTYRGGQVPVLHFEADLQATVDWAAVNNVRWAFTLQNAGNAYFEDRCDLQQLVEIDWAAVQATNWAGGLQEGKQAEFLVERSFPWELVSRIGVRTPAIRLQVEHALRDALHRPVVDVVPGWYY
jgi:hypothetical protein